MFYGNDLSLSKDGIQRTIEIISYMFMFSTGLFLSLIRMTEPYYRHVIW